MRELIVSLKEAGSVVNAPEQQQKVEVVNKSEIKREQESEVHQDKKEKAQPIQQNQTIATVEVVKQEAQKLH
jgi:hypothetical protein